jgi:hypothetical protein
MQNIFNDAYFPRIVPVAVHNPEANLESHPLVKKVRAFLAECAKPAPAVALPPRTHAFFLLDASGSMVTDKDVTIAGFNQQVDVVQEMAKEVGDTTVSLMTFSSTVEVRSQYRPVESLQKLTALTYRPQGGTALFDALGAAMEQAMAAPGATEANTAALIASFTDGDERDSRYCGAAVIAHCIKLLEGTGRFTFTLMGPNTHLETMGDVLKISKGNISGFDVSSRFDKARAFQAMSGATETYMTLRSKGVMASSALYAAPQPNSDPLG